MIAECDPLPFTPCFTDKILYISIKINGNPFPQNKNDVPLWIAFYLVLYSYKILPVYYAQNINDSVCLMNDHPAEDKPQ